MVSFWYNHVLRVVMGKLMTTTGDILDSAVNHAHKMSMQGRDIQMLGHHLAIENMERLDEYSSRRIDYWQQQEVYIPEQEDYAITPIKETNQGGLLVIEE
jgi:hypothetical protein